jgi:hypothetical protein
MSRRIGLVGYGRWGKIVAQKLDPNEIKCVFVRDAFKYQHADYLIETIDKFLRYDLSHIFILVPINDLEKLAKRALLAGANVFVEKPFTLNVDRLLFYSNYLKIHPEQKLHVNHLYRYSNILNDIDLNGVRALEFQWEKFSSSVFSPEINLISHDLSIIYTIFGINANFILLSNEFKNNRHVIKCIVNDIPVSFQYVISRDATFVEIKTLTVFTNQSKQYDFKSEPSDKLQASINDFFDGDFVKAQNNFEFHCAVATAMRSLGHDFW